MWIYNYHCKKGWKCGGLAECFATPNTFGVLLEKMGRMGTALAVSSLLSHSLWSSVLKGEKVVHAAQGKGILAATPV